MTSHEIRSQANTIIGFGELLSETPLGPEQHEFVARLTAAARRLVSFTTDIVDLAAARSAPRVQKTAFGVGEAVDEVCAATLPELRQKGLLLRCEVAPDVPPAVVGDRQRLHQVLTNLLRNALKFTDEGEVALRVTAPARTRAFVTLLFAVSDSGIGISPERREAIFEPFEQESAGTRRRFGGSGLGLAIARQLVHRMGGNMWLQSEPGVGSTFYCMIRFDLPDGSSDEGPPGRRLGLS